MIWNVALRRYLISGYLETIEETVCQQAWRRRKKFT